MSSAWNAIQIALHRGHEVSVVTRGENHIRQARELGAAWAGSDFRDLPGKVDGAVLFAPSGKLVPADIGGARSRRGLLHRRHSSQCRGRASTTAGISTRNV